jgi:hypothetical protein
MSGFNLPPGCSVRDIPGNDYDPPCDVCGQDCICPECPICGTAGDPGCYEQHGMTRTQEQIDGLAALEAQRAADDASMDQYAKECERTDNTEPDWENLK